MDNPFTCGRAEQIKQSEILKKVHKHGQAILAIRLTKKEKPSSLVKHIHEGAKWIELRGCWQEDGDIAGEPRGLERPERDTKDL